ncbi:phosphate ABC transporter permease PstA [Desulfohalovibrio reitneri]|uniref:phosphate ABC transporter permease PstA n=1 Tax=Desulfohalovibrio reitneri TaxID=1307759 RepID=UPI0004A74D09|nr:phosphate ABC transporter permease PstA [Desulfohalovibrio reitneri]
MDWSNIDQINKARRRKEKRFRLYSMAAIFLAGAFLVFFLGDIVTKGYPAFWQTKIQVEVSYNEASKRISYNAVERQYEELVSRGYLRLIPRRMDDNPDLMGTTRTEWVLATAEVDQYIKGKPNRLSPAEKEVVDRLESEGRAEAFFNFAFFTNGDSKLPEFSGIKAAAVGSFYVILLTFLFSFPIGVMCAIYLEEYAPDNRLTQIIEVNINNLAAIPSILFGLLGLAIFINFFEVPRSSALVGGLTLSLMTLPIIIIATRAAIRAIPDSIREGALALGATRWQVIWHHVLPLSLPGILTGTIIGLAQAMGETAPLLIVGMMAYIPEAPDGVTEATTVLPAQIYTWSSSALRAFSSRTAAGIIVLLFILLSMNGLAIWLRNKYERKW